MSQTTIGLDAGSNLSMLGILGAITLVLGGFIAGAGAFNWELLFSNGYREHGWVRSLGRDGARGLCLLFGGVLMIVGFVSEVVDATSQPVLASAAMPNPVADAETQLQSPLGESAPGYPPEVKTAPTVSPPTTARSTTRRSQGARADRRDSEPSSPPQSDASQPVTIFAPDVEPQENQTLVILRYRFEAGHQPLAGARYRWVVELPDAIKGVVYNSEALERVGQFTHIFDAPYRGAFDQTWSTRLEVESGTSWQQISNHLEIDAKGVHSTPLTPID